MSVLATRERDGRQPVSGSAEPPAQRLFESPGPTLEDSILATWHELASVEHATCPVCAGALSRAGRCASCGSELG
jgi:hypothetical protein